MNSNNKGKILFVVGIILIIISLGVVGGVLLFSNNKESEDNLVDLQLTPSNDSNYTIKCNGFSFEIPTYLMSTVQDNVLLLEDEFSTWLATIEIIEGKYNKLLTNKNELQQLYEKEGYTTSSVADKTLGKTSYITLEVSKDGENALLAIANANNVNMFGIVITNQNNDYDYNALEKIIAIIKRAKYLGGSLNVAGGNKLNLNIISDIAK